MAKEFTHTSIGICGGEYYFNRCSNKTLKQFDEEMEKKIKEIEPLTKQSDLLNSKRDKIDKQIESKERRINLLEERGNEEDIDTILKLQDDLDKLLDDKDKVLKEIEKFNEDNENAGEKLDQELNEILAKKVEALLDGITAKEFLEEADAIDFRIATNISKYYEMCMIGERESKIQNEIREDVQEFRQRQKDR